MFVSDYGMQYNILSRYGIKPYSVKDRDFKFANGDDTDLRYSNIILVNKYHGVSKEEKKGKVKYVAKRCITLQNIAKRCITLQV